MWLWPPQCWHSTLVPVSDRVCRQRSVRYRTMPRSLAGNPDSPQASVFLTSTIDEIVDVATYYIHYHAI